VAAFSLLELLFAMGIATTLTAMVVPALLSTMEEVRAAGAVRYIAGTLQQTRMDAVARSRETAIRFTQLDNCYVFAEYADGNRNGINGTDISRGVDPQIRPSRRLADDFPGVDFGTIPGLPSVDPSSVPPGADPIRLGSADMVTFSPHGTATPGSLYIRGHGSTQYVIRIFGETGKTRILKFNSRTRTWSPL
jgi:type II secretory pathway pseudopilin PulG